ncbi:MAG: DEAD/DEAH box helicase [Chlamydiia bacterium]|nr:DEAD/DEAH box helicase [Chlamydiia bacterium]
MDKRSSFVEPFKEIAQEYIVSHLIGQINFVGSTYQIEVFDRDSRETVWPFLKFAGDGSLQDAFCSCEKGDQQGRCEHLAASLLRIFMGHALPLHLRFESSFWNGLCRLFSDHLGSVELKERKEGEFYVHDIESARFFKIVTLQKKITERLRQIFFERRKETEENSLKFSDLSLREIKRWKEGRPSSHLRYLLSCWFDLATWQMAMQDEGFPYTLSFGEVNHFPCEITIKWEAFQMTAMVEKEDLPVLIPTLASIDAPLKILSMSDQALQGIFYDRKKREFVIEKGEAVSLEKRRGVKLDGWYYLKQEGFYQEEGKGILAQSTIKEEEIADALGKYKKYFDAYLKDETLHDGIYHLQYYLYFDKEWNWHFEGYLFERGDLSKEDAVFFGAWAYLPDQGFYQIGFSLFESSTATVDNYNVSAFIDEYRMWLEDQRGFKVHLAGLETQMCYTVDENGTLEFKTSLTEGEGSVDSRDFGEWIYTTGEGFFSKNHSRLGLTIRPGLLIRQPEVSDFIKTHRDELETISHFFSSSDPLKKRGLALSVVNEHEISITPHHELYSHLLSFSVKFFQDFVYLDGGGFAELPLSQRLPEKYQYPLLLKGEQLSFFLRFELKTIEPHIISCDTRLKRPHVFELEIMHLTRNPEGGLRAKLFLRTEYGTISITNLKNAVNNKKRFLFTDAGLIDLDHEELSWLKSTRAEFDLTTEIVNLSTMEFLRLDAAFGFLAPETTAPEGGLTRRLLNELRNFYTPYFPNLKGLKSDLRPYQQAGLNWLWFLYQNDLAGILCDEMGLGKTHQTMALLAAVSNLKTRGSKRVLVVCPTSVIYHWEDKLSRFLPKMKVRFFHGMKRTLKRLPKEIVVLTSYGICRTENKELSKIKFDVAVFDELQIAKNPNSRVHQALSTIEAKMRLGLTGTPIENSLRELKALLDIVLPGYMPGDTTYRKVFVIPIEKEHNGEKTALLRQLIHPFILRRKKKEVLAELPEKYEEKFLCLLSKEQTELYTSLIAEIGRPIIKELKENKGAFSYIHIFSILSKLKQICNHPALYKNDILNYRNYRSGKWELFVEILDEALESGQKVVVFSQYLKMLDIIKSHLREKRRYFAEIRGNTLDRKEQIKRFQEDRDCHVFIGSLQAAGLGIDLTAASTVILYDRWWNAARENQAIDRVHRIGQKWGVQVFKFISKGTIEEKIDRMVMKKKKLLEDVVTTDDQDAIKTFSRNDLLELLTFLPYEEEENLDKFD